MLEHFNLTAVKHTSNKFLTNYEDDSHADLDFYWLCNEGTCGYLLSCSQD